MIPAFRVAIIPGNGIDKEVMPEGLRVIQAAAGHFGLQLEYRTVDWASCDYCQQHGQVIPNGWKAQFKGMDAIFFDTVGWPATVPDHVPLWGSLPKSRRKFNRYVNLCSVRLFEGMPCPLANRKPSDIDYYVVRESTEGEYTSLSGIIYEGTDREIVIQESVYSRRGAEWLLKPTFDLAQSRQRRHVTPATKSNGIAISMPWWDKRAEEVAQGYPDVTLDKQHIDILTARFVLQPNRFDVVAATNLFGDTLSGLDPATTDTIDLAPSVSLNPDRTFPSLLEPVYSSVSDIYGKNITNPAAMIWSDALMLDFLTQGQGAGCAAHDAIVAAIEAVLKDDPCTPDLGDTANTTQAGEAIAAYVAAHRSSSAESFTRIRYAFLHG